MSRAGTVAAVATGTGDAQALAALGGRRLLSWSIRESAGTPAVATAILRVGTLATDTPLAFIELAANQSVNQGYGDRGVDVSAGLFLDRVAGETELSVVWATV